MARAFISYTGHAEPDSRLAKFFEEYLSQRQHEVFIQTKIAAGQTWPEIVDAQLKAAQYLIVLLSTSAGSSEMVIEELRSGVRLRESQGRPVMLPVRLGTVELPYDVRAKVNRIQQLKWTRSGDEDDIAAKLHQLMSAGRELPEESDVAPSAAGALSPDGAKAQPGADVTNPLPAFDPSWLKSLDGQGGAVRLESPFYVERTSDTACKQRILGKGCTLLINGSRQSGKSSLLARLYQHAGDQQLAAVYFDFQALSSKVLQDLDSLLLQIATQIYDDLQLTNDPQSRWRADRSAGTNLTRYLQDEIIARNEKPVLLIMDEVDKIFQYPSYRDDFFGLVRSWHSKRAFDRKLAWLNLVLAYSSEASGFIENLDQSPFNVGETFQLLDFDREQLGQLNHLHGSPVRALEDLEKLMGLLGGHPFLVRHALYVLTAKKCSVSDLEATAVADDGPFGGHLQYYMLRLHESSELKQPMKAVLLDGVCPDDISFYRLRSLGLVRGPVRNEAQPRCGLYARYFGARL